jgi:hypothetical protein
LAIELQHITKKYPILLVFYRYQKRFKYHILAHMLGSLGTPASSTTITGRHDITERDIFTLLSAIAFYIVVFYVILSRVHLSNISRWV